MNFEMTRDLAKYRWNTVQLMRRYRCRALTPWTEAELRAAWGDR